MHVTNDQFWLKKIKMADLLHVSPFKLIILFIVILRQNFDPVAAIITSILIMAAGYCRVCSCYIMLYRAIHIVIISV